MGPEELHIQDRGEENTVVASPSLVYPQKNSLDFPRYKNLH